MATRKSSRHSDDVSALLDVVGSQLSTATIFFHAAVAEQIGLGPTEAKCRTLLVQRPMTAGELASITGLTTGAMTGVIDRLEATGVGRRTYDPTDRRRVIVELVSDPRRDRELEVLFGPLRKAIQKLASRYSRKDLEKIVGFLIEASEILKRETQRLRERHT